MKQYTGLWILVALAGLLAVYTLGAFWQYIIFAILFSVVFSGHYRRLCKHVHPNTAAILIVLSVLVLLVVPTLYVVSSTVSQAPAAYQGALEALSNPSVRNFLGVTGDDVQLFMIGVGEKLRENVLQNAGAYITQVSNVFIGLFILFITLFFLLRDGDVLYAYLTTNVPVSKKEAEQFLFNMKRIIRAVLLGQVVTAIILGILAGMFFFAIGIPNPLFWGVITTLLSIIPVLGPFMVYLPASVYLVLQERYFAGIAMLLFGVFILSQIDNFIRPYIASRESKVHPLIVILGVIGGLKLWGLAGFVIGPLILAGFVALYEFAAKHWDSR